MRQFSKSASGNLPPPAPAVQAFPAPSAMARSPAEMPRTRDMMATLKELDPLEEQLGLAKEQQDHSPRSHDESHDGSDSTHKKARQGDTVRLHCMRHLSCNLKACAPWHVPQARVTTWVVEHARKMPGSEPQHAAHTSSPGGSAPAQCTLTMNGRHDHEPDQGSEAGSDGRAGEGKVRCSGLLTSC